MSFRWIHLGLLSLFIHMPLAAELAMREIRITDALGDVTLKAAERSGDVHEVDQDTPLTMGDVLITGLNSKAEVTINGETVLKLKANSRLHVLKSYTNNLQLELEEGALLAKIKKAKKETQGMLLKMPTAVVVIRGTELGAETHNGVTYVGVFDEGEVIVAGAWGHEHVKLGPNQETRITLSNVPSVPGRMTHFRAYRSQMVEIRHRANFWRTRWKPMPQARKRYIRERLMSSHKGPSRGFDHSAFKPTPKKPAPAIRKAPPAKHPVKKRAKRS